MVWASGNDSSRLQSIAHSANLFMFPLPALWLIACFVLQIALVSHGPYVDRDILAWVWVGLMWAGWAGCCWLTSAIRNLAWWLVTIACFGVWHAGWMAIGREQPVEFDPIREEQRTKFGELVLRYALMFGGYAFAQSMMFRFFRVPAWEMMAQRGTMRLGEVEVARRQFSIVELLLMMTATALLISGAKQYQPPNGVAFWSGLPLVFLSFAGTATFCGLSSASTRMSSRRCYAVGTVFTVFAGSFFIAWIDKLLSPKMVFVVSWMPYFGIQGTFAVCLIVLAMCGARPIETVDIKTPIQPSSDDDEFPPSADLLPFRPPLRK